MKENMVNIRSSKDYSKNFEVAKNFHLASASSEKLYNPDELVTIYFPGYFIELKKGDPSIPAEQEKAKIAMFREATLSVVDVGSMSEIAKEIFGDTTEASIELPAEIEYTLSSWLQVSNDQSAESLSSGAVKDLLGNTDAYKNKLSNIAWKAEAVKNHPALNLSQDVKDYLESKGIDLALIRSPKFLSSTSEKGLKGLISLLNKYQQEIKSKKTD